MVMENRDIAWFYRTGIETATIYKLPPYLELYYQVFSEQFDGADDEEKRYHYLCWLVSTQMDSSELELAKGDKYISELLDKKNDASKLFGEEVYLSNYQYHYFQSHSKMFNEWGFSLSTAKEQESYLAWCYSRGLCLENNHYLKSTAQRFLTNSDKYHLEGFDVTKSMMLLMDLDSDFIPPSDDLMNRLLKRRIGVILFDYGQYCYPLTDVQVNQLVGMKGPSVVFKEFWWYFFEAFGLNEDNYDSRNDYFSQLPEDFFDKLVIHDGSPLAINFYTEFKYVNHLVFSVFDNIRDRGRDVLFDEEVNHYSDDCFLATILSSIENAEEYSNRGEYELAMMERSSIAVAIENNTTTSVQILSTLNPLLQNQFRDAALYCGKIASLGNSKQGLSESYWEKGALLLGKLLNLNLNQPDWIRQCHEVYLQKAGVFFVRLMNKNYLDEVALVNICEKGSVMLGQLLAGYPEQQDWVRQYHEVFLQEMAKHYFQQSSNRGLDEATIINYSDRGLSVLSELFSQYPNQSEWAYEKEEILLSKVGEYYTRMCRLGGLEEDFINNCKRGVEVLSKLISKYPAQPDWVLIMLKILASEIIPDLEIDLSTKDIHPALRQKLQAI